MNLSELCEAMGSKTPVMRGDDVVIIEAVDVGDSTARVQAGGGVEWVKWHEFSAADAETIAMYSAKRDTHERREMDMDEWCKKASAERAVREALQEAQIKAALVKYAAHETWQVWKYNLPALSLKLIGPRNRMVEAIAIMQGWCVNGREGNDLAAMLDDATDAGGRAIGV